MSELDRLRAELGEVRAALRDLAIERQRGDEVLASAIKRSRLHIQAQEHAETWKRLDPDVSLLRWQPRAGDVGETPDLSGSLVARLRRGDPVADSLGNVDAIGRVNLLWNPLLEGLTEISLVSGVWTAWGPDYEGRYDTNSGVDSVSGLGDAYSRYSPGANPYNSSICDIDTGPVAGGAFDQTIRVRAYPWYYPDFGETTNFPYLGASVQVGRYGNDNHVNLTKYDAWLEIYRADDSAGTNGVVAAASDIVDMMAYAGSYASVKLSCVVEEPAAGWWSYVWWWRLCLNCAYNTETVTGGDWLTWGEPLLALSSSQSVPPFGPLVGSWTPTTVRYYQSAETEPRMELDAGGLWFGPGTTALDTAVRRKYATPGAIEIVATGTNDQALYIGDDAILYDVDIVDRLGIKGQVDATAGGFTFGSSKKPELYRQSDEGLTLKHDAATGAVPLIKRKASDQQILNTNVLTNVTGVEFAVKANSVYSVKWVVVFTVDSATTDGIQLAVTGPTGCVPTFNTMIPTTATARSFQRINALGSAATTATIDSTTARNVALVEGIIVNGSNAGTVYLQAASDTATTGDVTIKAGTYLELA